MRASEIAPLNLSFKLENFEGPLEFLLHLIQKEEMDIYEIPLNVLITQFLKSESHSLDSGAEFLGNASFLLWLKSKTLLPNHDQEPLDELLDLDPRFEIIHQLLEYCRFKQAAKEISLLEQKQAGFYPRGNEHFEHKKPLGIEHLSLNDLAQHFQEVLAKASPKKSVVQEEEWKVSDKISLLEALLEKKELIHFESLFTKEMGRLEIIVIFLAVLELMKMGRMKIIRKENELYASRNNSPA